MWNYTIPFFKGNSFSLNPRLKHIHSSSTYSDWVTLVITEIIRSLPKPIQSPNPLSYSPVSILTHEESSIVHLIPLLQYIQFILYNIPQYECFRMDWCQMVRGVCLVARWSLSGLAVRTGESTSAGTWSATRQTHTNMSMFYVSMTSKTGLWHEI